MRKPREVIITHRVLTRAPLSLLRKTAAYSQLVVCSIKGDVYSMQLIESRAHVPEPWEEERDENS